MTTRSWVPVPEHSDFPVQNLPYGIFSRAGEPPRAGVAIGEYVLDLSRLGADAGLPYAEDFAAPSLNPFMARGREAWRAVRARLTELLTDEAHRAAVEPHLVPRAEVTLHLPFEVADYVDFYASEHHASNVGRVFRPTQPPLTPNWKHLPIGYHGRAGTVVVSGTPVVRPCGQRKAPDAEAPGFGPSARLDIEAEVGFVVGTPSELGRPVSAADFADHVFGVVLVNDWSARDIQAWEYVPLGPFLGKSFATSVSPWVVPLEALEAARVAPPAQDPEPLPYLRTDEPWGLDLAIEVACNGEVVSRPPFSTMYWTAAQMLAHMTVNGASLRTGDFYASGTVSGPEPDQRGSFLELGWNGTEPVKLADGSTRAYLADGDTVTLRATAPGRDGVRIGFGEVSGTVEPAREAAGSAGQAEQQQ
ncbi:fumarylacetoacetase [Streptomyces purpurogeneiscleroticus]|uniref:fumarylacetoacetase n=1 Tax=Streptomyces purpurogeneiscleroticus TaxID=68259 RepID=UPI001CBE910B|nr:fumarylacetoacetase [Streptomyces purpurogeneiscleroticus]MBZ4014552.1 fumarylacetoacetase [Streptomyces purpurogeneiscleroticus]